MANTIRIALAQLNLIVGDVPGNAERIAQVIKEARDSYKAQLVVFQELALCGYPPEDLLFHAGLRQRVASALEDLQHHATGIAALIGYPEYDGDRIFNAAALLADGAMQGNYRKWELPNYSVFDEARYFSPGQETLVADVNGVPVGITICEDVWEGKACAAAARDGARLIVTINGSPFEVAKQIQREKNLGERARETGVPLVYQNLVGGQDELVFDGGSCVVDAKGVIRFRAPAFEEGIYTVDFKADKTGVLKPETGNIAPLPGEDESTYTAIVTGVRDYVQKNGFHGVVLGLSGGVDSALCLAIAVDALGADAVQAVMMPYRYTSEMSLEDAEQQAGVLGVDYQIIPIEGMVESTRESLRELFGGLSDGTTEENIQSRCRGMLLMAISNKTQQIVLTTGNKSEMAVGYATLYGDMAGGFAPIKDCTKTFVYRLARYRNGISPVIPKRVIEREPTAELRPGQKDIDSLPPYDILDPILDALMIDDQSVDEIAGRGFDRGTVGQVLEMVRRNEYKRRQSPPCVRISGRAFGRDWRYPLTSGYGRSK
ncbi:MAG: NAD+ synthase [Gammaproteobacteria bacterium]|nr:NAD+ synthase [Gammaproteobacteria bacterium]